MIAATFGAGTVPGPAEPSGPEPEPRRRPPADARASTASSPPSTTSSAAGPSAGRWAPAAASCCARPRGGCSRSAPGPGPTSRTTRRSTGPVAGRARRRHAPPASAPRAGGGAVPGGGDRRPRRGPAAGRRERQRRGLDRVSCARSPTPPGRSPRRAGCCGRAAACCSSSTSAPRAGGARLAGPAHPAWRSGERRVPPRPRHRRGDPGGGLRGHGAPAARRRPRAAAPPAARGRRARSARRRGLSGGDPRLVRARAGRGRPGWRLLAAAVAAHHLPHRPRDHAPHPLRQRGPTRRACCAT